MTVPEIERLNSDIIEKNLQLVKDNMDLIVKVDINEHADYEGYTKIDVIFRYLKRVGK